MSSDPFNSVGGYSIGIPPQIVIDEVGNITSPSGTIGNLNGNVAVFTTVTADDFYGTFHGSMTGNLVMDVDDKQVVFADSTGLSGGAGAPTGSPNLTFDRTSNTLTLIGGLVVDSVTMGTGVNEFCTNEIRVASSFSNSPNQILHRIPAAGVASMDYTIVATNPTANVRQTSKLFASVLGDDVGYFEYGTIDVPLHGPGIGDFKVLYDSGDVVLTVTPFSSDLVGYKIMITSYKD